MPIIEHKNGEELNIPSEGKYAIMFHLPGRCAGCTTAKRILEGKNLQTTVVELIDAGDEANRPILDAYEPQSAPTVIVFENGKQIARMSGVKEFLAGNSVLDE